MIITSNIGVMGCDFSHNEIPKFIFLINISLLYNKLFRVMAASSICDGPDTTTSEL